MPQITVFPHHCMDNSGSGLSQSEEAFLCNASYDWLCPLPELSMH